jgi:preprotein translocase subunit YajC
MPAVPTTTRAATGALTLGAVLVATSAHAQAAGGLGGGNLQDMAIQFLPLIGLVALFYFLMIRPQQQRMKQHQASISSIKRGDSVVLSSGVIGKIVRVEDAEVGVEIATGVTVKVKKSMISEVQSRGTPAPANDAKV